MPPRAQIGEQELHRRVLRRDPAREGDTGRIWLNPKPLCYWNSSGGPWRTVKELSKRPSSLSSARSRML